MPSAAPSAHRRRTPAQLVAALALLLMATCAFTASSPSAAFGADASAAGVTPGDAPPDSFWGDTASIPPAQNVLMVKILNRTNGTYPDDQVYWTFNGETHSIAEQPYVDMPANSAGRMYFHLGSPDSQYADFIEFTVGDAQFNGNTTRVDGFGLKLAMRLHAQDGSDQEVGEDYETFQQDRSATFQEFTDEVPTEFKELAQDQAPYRIPSPGNDPAFQAGGQYADYFTGYAQSVGVDAPTTDIVGCGGSLSGDPGMCSALNRHVAQLPQSQWSTPSLYYQDAPANYYARFWHDHAIDNLAYGFPYDDYAGQSSFVSHDNPQWLEVAVGW
jgi:Beta-1,3-glucanase